MEYENSNDCRRQSDTSIHEDGRCVLYTVKEVSVLLKTNIDYVHRLRKAGILPFLKLGQYKVRKQSLDEFLAKYEGKDLTDPYHVKELNADGE